MLMSKYDAIIMILGSIPSIVGDYFAMVLSGDQSAIIGGLFGLLGISVITYRILKRFWRRIVLGAVFN